MTHKSISLTRNIKIIVLIVLAIVILIIITGNENEFVGREFQTKKKNYKQKSESRCSCWITILIKNSLEIK